jgi:hypothetical protein
LRVLATHKVKLIILIVFITLYINGYSQPSVASGKDSTEYKYQHEKDFAGVNDTLKINSRGFSNTEVEKLKNDPNLNYHLSPTIAESLWVRFKQWMNWFLESLFEKAVTTDLGRVIMYVLAGFLLIVVIMMLLKVNAFKVFYSGADQGQRTYQVIHENIHEMNFEKLIQEATEKDDFRLATRLIFLHALKILSDNHQIEYNQGKTNHDYVDELTSSDLIAGFNELSFYFDYAWYGNFSISNRQFERVKNTFAEWRAKIN